MFVQTLACRLDPSHVEQLVALVNAYRSPQAPGALLLLRGITDPDAHVVVAVFASQEEAVANEKEPATGQSVKRLSSSPTA